MGREIDNKLSLCWQLLENCRNELMVLYPHLDAAFACLGQQALPGGESIAVDGARLQFSPDWLIGMYSRHPAQLRRGYLHMLLHCLFLHPFSRQKQDAAWDVACDMAVEHVIEKEHQPRLRLPESEIRSHCFEILGPMSLSPERIAEMLRQGEFPYSVEDLQQAFAFDDHDIWYQQKAEAIKNRWQTMASGAENKRRGGRPGSSPGALEDVLAAIQPRDRDYRSWLRQFTVVREELELDIECFDPMFYHFGWEHYGNMPLIEPLEYKEVARLEELVIAIDTSGSCSRETVQRFLEDTFSILSSRENFFREMKVYLIQCDCMVQDVQILRSAEDWQRCSRQITIQGRGGTDFTPVFRYVDQLRREKKLKKLRALLYFTDGEGFYPREKPEYETAFVFSRESEYIQYAPPWARKLLLGGRHI